jgi:hypothetical protein
MSTRGGKDADNKQPAVHGTAPEHHSSAATHDGPGLTRLRFMLRQGGASFPVDEVGDLLATYPREQPAMMMELQKTVGNGLAMQAIQRASAPKATVARSNDDHAAAASPVRQTQDLMGSTTTMQSSPLQDGRTANVLEPQLRTSRVLATADDNIHVVDSAGNILDGHAVYSLVTVPTEHAHVDRNGTPQVTDTQIRAHREILVTLATGEQALLTIDGVGQALIEYGQPLDPRRELIETSVAPRTHSRLNLGPTGGGEVRSEWGPAGTGSIVASGAGHSLLNYDDPAQQLRAVVQALHDAKVNPMRAKNTRLGHLRDKFEQRYDAILPAMQQLGNARAKQDDGDESVLPYAEDLLRNLTDAVASTPDASNGDRIVFERWRRELLHQFERIEHPRGKSIDQHVLDLIDTPGRLIKRTLQGGVGLTKTVIDAGALGIASFGKATGLYNMTWDPISDIGIAVKDQHMSSTDVLVGIPMGFVHNWEQAWSHLKRGDISLAIDASIDTYFTVEGGIAGARYAIGKGGAVATRLIGLSKQAATFAEDLKLPTAIRSNARAFGKTVQFALSQMSEAAEPELAATAGGGAAQSVAGKPRGFTMDDLKNVFLSEKLDAAEGRALDSIHSRGGKSKIEGSTPADVIPKMKALFDGDTEGLTKVFDRIDQHLQSPDAYFAALQELIETPHLRPQLRDVVNVSLARTTVDPVAFLADVQWAAKQSLAPEALAALINRATRGELSLSSIRGAGVSAEELTSIAAGSDAPGPKRFVNQFPEHDVHPPRQVYRSDRMQNKTGEFNYVVMADGKLILGRESKQPGGGHIDLTGGQPVLAAGEVSMRNGVIKYIDNSSGHYLPNGASMEAEAIAAFEREGFEVSGKFVHKRWDGEVGKWVKL